MYSGRFAKTVTNVHDCYVHICNATLCLHNEGKKCTLEKIVIGDDGKCMQLQKEEDKPPKEVKV
tara:strand:+ start:216 stop:407 length:192 start_codon:yes stop_codon:yes gene_type:complete